MTDAPHTPRRDLVRSLAHDLDVSRKRLRHIARIEDSEELHLAEYHLLEARKQLKLIGNDAQFDTPEPKEK